MHNPSILLQALEIGSPQPQNGDVQQLLHYIDSLSFSSAAVINEHSLNIQDQDVEMAKQEPSFFQRPKVAILQNRSLNHSKNKNFPPDIMIKSQEFPDFTPIRRKSSSLRSPPSSKTSRRLDPIGSTPLKAKENVVHDTSRYIYTREEEPIGSSPMRLNERHLFQSSRHYLSDEESSASSLISHGQLDRSRASSSFVTTKANEYPNKSLAPSPARRRHKPELEISPRRPLEQSLEHSIDEAWSIVLGDTIIEESEAEDEKKQVQSMATTNQEHLLHGPTTPGISRTSKILDDLPETVKSPEDAKHLLRTAVHTLQGAREERESARQWATDMKDAVHKWVEQQRQLMKNESSRTESQAWQQSQLHSLLSLESSVQKLCQEVHSSNQQRTSTEEKLHHLLIDQREKIQSMSEEVLSMKEQIQHMEQQVNQPSKTNTPTYKVKDKVTTKSSSKTKLETPSRSMASSTASSRVRKEGKDGGHIIIYGNGVRKEVHKDGTTVIRFTNGDVETKFSGGTIAYFHAKDRIMQINNTADGSTLFEYPNRQIERHYTDGSKAILFADGTRQRISAQGKVDTAFVKAQS